VVAAYDDGTGTQEEQLQKYVQESNDLWAPYDGNLPVAVVGSVVGTHAGPGAVAVGFFAAE
jgi:fatty acid-binding protein DegV